MNRILAACLKLAGLQQRGRANCLDIRAVIREQPLPGIPAAFDGFRLLHLSDLHLGLLPGFTEALIARIRATPHDLAVITGDFVDGCFQNCLDDIRRIAEALDGRALAVLGNHDVLELVPHLEARGIRVLLNENTFVEKDGQRLWFAGIDDPCFHRTHDLDAASRGIPPDACSILLSHDPATGRDAEMHGFAFMLCGHTHGGQICLPGGWALIRSSRCPSAQFTGAWSHRKLHGYTSPGAGSRRVAARFNCPPEITLHVLRSFLDSAH